MVDRDGRSNILYLMEPTTWHKQGLAISLIQHDSFRLVKVGKLLCVDLADIVGEITQRVA